VIVRSDAFGAPGDSAPSLSFDAPRIVIGRGDGCEVRLPDASVSSRHATLRQHGGTYLLCDEGSANGTFVGGVRLAAQSPRVITGGDLVRVGRVWLEIRFDAAPVSSTQHDTKELALALVQRAMASLGEDVEPRVVVRQGPDAGKRLALPANGTPYVLGRGHGADLELDETDASRRHVQLTRKGEVLYVRDLGSKNGTYLGDSRLDSGRDIPWRGAEPLRIGKDHFFYENPAAEALSELERSADEPIAEGESIAPPSPDGESESAEPPVAASPGGAAPVAAVPRGNALARPEPPSGWGPSDVVIVLIATSLLVLSVVGLYLLFK
jgi:pSer/pThr/pTyr-binding forkhead associated (FHA) protein